MKKFTVMALALTLCFAASAQAATVTFTLTLGASGPGTFKVEALASNGDNFGIASYGLQLVGNPVAVPTGSIESVNHNSLRAAALTGDVSTSEGPAGFTLLRSNDLTVAQANQSAHTLNASQDTVTPTPFLIRGFGQTSGNVAAALGETTTGTISEGNPWTQGPNGFTIAVGTYIPVPFGGQPGIARGLDILRPGSAATYANVFTSSDGIATEAAQIVRVTVIPEPATMALAGMGLVGCILAARRRVA